MSEEQIVKKIHEHVLAYFCELKKTLFWWNTPSPLLGGISPFSMVRAGRAKKLLKVVESWKAEGH